MTDQSYDKPLKEVPLAPAALQACKECQWRASNSDTLDEKRGDETFSREKFTSRWRDITVHGSTFSCHLTTPGYYPHDETLEDAGFGIPQMFKGQSHRQCSGQISMIRNELGKMDEYVIHADYLADHPTGLN